MTVHNVHNLAHVTYVNVAMFVYGGVPRTLSTAPALRRKAYNLQVLIRLITVLGRMLLLYLHD
jgi:hypothetical protein